MWIDRRLIAHFDWWLFALTLLIPGFGLVVLYSAGYVPDSSTTFFGLIETSIESPTAVKQASFVLIGLAALVISMSVSSQSWFRLSYLFYAVCIFLLVAVLLIGTVSHGSRRWIALGGFSLQPAELTKIALVLAFGRFLSKNLPKQGGYKLRELILPSLFFVVPMLLIMKQPDLGTALSIGATGFAMLLFVGIRPRSLLILVMCVLVSLYPAWSFLKPYQQRRVMALFNPEADVKGAGYHINQSKIAIGSGGITGKGFLKGTQTQLEFLPEHTTDFVFAVLAEEWGFLGAGFVLFLYFCFIYRILRISMRCRDLYPVLVSFGIAFLVFFHTVVNIGMVIGIMPVVGLPLPLFSYGGSSMVSVMFAIGIVLGISMRRLFFATRG